MQKQVIMCGCQVQSSSAFVAHKKGEPSVKQMRELQWKNDGEKVFLISMYSMVNPQPPKL